MKIEGSADIIIQGNILSGYYSQSINKGVRGRLFSFSSPTHPLSDFHPPYDAYLPSSSGVRAAAQRAKSPTDPLVSDRSGVLYYYDSATIYGTCHGWGRTKNTYYSGFNFYQAFYPLGYFNPPYGESLSIFTAIEADMGNLAQGGCAPMSVTEYNETFGIVSQVAPDANLSNSSLVVGTLTPIYYSKAACPDDSVTNFYDEVNYKLIPGTSSSLGATTVNAGQAVPTSADISDIKVFGRYQTVTSGDYKNIQFSPDGRPIPSYSPTTQNSKLNNTLCEAQLNETSVLAGVGQNGLMLLETPDVSLGGAGDQTSTIGADDFHYWHFAYRENSNDMPFSDGFDPVQNGFLRGTTNQGTQLFIPTISSEDYYWQNRQCPSIVDYLPWTMGASIYACPSDHFDIPYYAAIRKFGFYGTRFLNSCTALNLAYPLSGVPNATELIGTNDPPTSIGKNELEPDGLDIPGEWSFQAYDDLLKTAKAEEMYSNMYALNKGFFLWANAPYLTGDSNFAYLCSYSGFLPAYNNLYSKFQRVFTSGLTSFTGSEPMVILQMDGANSTYAIADSGFYSDLLFTNRAYNDFRTAIEAAVTGGGLSYWFPLEDAYSYYVTDGQGGINETFYSNIVSGREKRIRTRYFENVIRGNPIDLFPMNHVAFSFDNAMDYLEHTGWARSPYSVSALHSLPDVNRRYFEGAYGSANQITGLLEAVNALTFSTGTAYYPGFFNNLNFNKDIPKPSYHPVLSGKILDSQGRRFSPSGWLAAGYNEIGQLDGNFSCFTPIFIQQPLQKVFCKIGQTPTFRAQAVDYHSIPDDKINYKYPEVMYWAVRLKLVDSQMKSLYPVKYKWYRIPLNKYSSLINSGDFTFADPSNITGEWCCAEGDTNNCTVIHPNECYPVYSGPPNDSYTFIKGAKKNVDDGYYYFCVASGRFGIRMSEPSQLMIEDWLRFDVSFKNGMNVAAGLSIDFVVNDTGNATQTISVASAANDAYCGYQQDPYAIPETAVEQKIPPPNAGFGDVTAYRFIGPVGYVGATRSYKPSTLYDTRGLREQFGTFMDYGALIPFETNLSQQQGDLLYGYQHLPQCTNYSMLPGQKGVMVMPRVGNYAVSHWALMQTAFAAVTSNVGIKWDKLSNIGQLYPPAQTLYEAQFPNKGIGHWLWGNNLGAIKRFGYYSTSKTEDIQFLGNGAATTDDMINKVKAKLVTKTTLAGWNCGFTPYGMGRNMLYFIEAYDRFYDYCDPVKKKNIQNPAYMNPGLRSTNSAIQYFWMGHPNNTYVERRPMYGPYAYKWRVRRHNRDRNGNGMSEGFYSMGWGDRYSLMYDMPAVYGLYLKRDATPQFKQQVANITQLRQNALGQGVDMTSIRHIWFGELGDEGTSRPYGDIWFTCNDARPGFNSALCDYVTNANTLRPDYKAYGCPENLLKEGQCFDPCISIRYGQGFFPAGKAQDMFGYAESSSSTQNTKNLRLVPMATKDDEGNTIVDDEKSTIDRNVVFRSPVNTPHAMIWRGVKAIKGSTFAQEDIAGIAACKDGGSDHCNYMTPTIHLGTSCGLIGQTTAFNASAYFISNLYESYNTRGAGD